MKPQVFAFAKINNEVARKKVYDCIKLGKSRFGMWDQKVSLKENYHGGNRFLLQVKPGDWIVHVNSPQYGHCVAAQATGTYGFDEGILCPWGIDFRNYIPVAPETIVEFKRNDRNVAPSVNLSPMRRGQRVLQVEDFLRSLENLKNHTVVDYIELRSVTHLRERFNEELLPRVTKYIHNLNRGKDFERFLHQIFEKMPNVLSIQNGFGWRSDHGADLIVEFQNPIVGITLSSKLIVQAKSYCGDHADLFAIDQIVEGIFKYKGHGGLLVTTGKRTEQLENYAINKSREISMPIDIIAGSEVASFVMRYGLDLLRV